MVGLVVNVRGHVNEWWACGWVKSSGDDLLCFCDDATILGQTRSARRSEVKGAPEDGSVASDCLRVSLMLLFVIDQT